MQLNVHLAIVLVLLLFGELKASENHDSVDIIASTKLGRVKGSLMKTRLGKRIYAFRGVYYAEPPTGQLRFKPPVPVKPWENVFDASKEGPACPQKIGINLSENCLSLNIYTKQLPNNKDEIDVKVPVIVYMHPGIFKEASSQSFLYGPDYLLDHNIVLVTINYRLASLGFLNLGDERALGNQGLKDQVAALRFVQENIAAFGGDPDSVTLTGQSAGSRSIVLHMISPMSRGLFHRAIGLSGSMTTPIPAQREQIGVAKKQARLLNCTTETIDEMFRCLLEKPADEFGKSIPEFAEWNNQPALVWYPAVEPDIPGVERFLTDDPEKLLRSGKIYQVPLIMGTTRDEYSFRATKSIKQAQEGNDSFFQELTDRWYELAPICFEYERNTNRSKLISGELFKFYFDDQPITLNNSDGLRRLYADAHGHFPIYKAASLIAQFSPSPIYFYEFAYESPYSSFVWSDTKKPKAGVAHGDDLQYIFTVRNDIYHDSSNVPIYNDSCPQILMVKRLTTLWAHFAKTGEPLPNDSDLFDGIAWERLTPERKSYLNIEQNLNMQSNFMSETMNFWHNLFP